VDSEKINELTDQWLMNHDYLGTKALTDVDVFPYKKIIARYCEGNL